jgi:hypothetical protein
VLCLIVLVHGMPARMTAAGLSAGALQAAADNLMKFEG